MEVPESPNPKGLIRRVQAEPVAAPLQWSVSTDSVVARIELSTTQTASNVLVDWGDGQVDRLWALPGSPSSGAAADQLEPGIYEFFHRYDLPEDRERFQRLVSLGVAGSGGMQWDHKPVTVIPRFRIRQYQMYLVFPKCDFLGGGNFRIKAFVSTDVESRDLGEWQYDMPGGDFPSTLLASPKLVVPGSNFTLELSNASSGFAWGETQLATHAWWGFHVWESDIGGFSEHFWVLGGYSRDDLRDTPLNSSHSEVRKNYGFNYLGDSDGAGCSGPLHVSYDWDFTLVANMPGNGGWASFKALAKH